MENFRERIEYFKKIYIHAHLESKGLNKHMLFGAYKKIVAYLELNYNSFDELKKTLISASKKAYTVDGRELTEEEIIELEYERAIKEYKEKQLASTTEEGVLTAAEYCFERLSIFKKLDKDIQREKKDIIKQKIAELDILLDIDNGLYYETFLYLVNYLDCSNILGMDQSITIEQEGKEGKHDRNK